MKPSSRILVCFAAVTLAVNSKATNQMTLLYNEAVNQLDSQPSQDSPFFIERFKQAFNERADETFSDSFGPFERMHRYLRHSDGSWRDYLDKIDDAAGDSIYSSLEYSLRDAALTLPLGSWMNQNHDFLSDFFVNSVDAVEEESVAPLNPNYVPNERRWWRRIAKSETFQYGVRPFRTDPYAFLSFQVMDTGRPALLGHVRYFYRDFADHRFQLAVSMPFEAGIALDMGTAYQFGANDDEMKAVVKFTKTFRSGGVAHLGMELRNTPTLVAGITLPL
ncbi:MAG TPA: hypothetical protein PKA41_17785 [Verrucomicrobiota bacterium]|nr:hypothetical protein [Verrucomicrobiota bacterium]